LLNNYGKETIITNNRFASSNKITIYDYSSDSLIYQNLYNVKGYKVNYSDVVEFFIKAFNSTRLSIAENTVNITSTETTSSFKVVQFEKDTSSCRVMDNVFNVEFRHHLYPLIVDNGRNNTVCASNVLNNARKQVSVKITDKMMDPSC